MTEADQTATDPAPLRHFVAELAKAATLHGDDEAVMLDTCRALMLDLVKTDDWLPAYCARPDASYYQQHLLYGDPLDRFSIVSFVWGPGQTTPIHDHTVWGVIGMLRGSERDERFELNADGMPVPTGEVSTLKPGDVGVVSPAIGDIHRVSNAYEDQVSISIHAYGGNIGRIFRHVYQPDGTVKAFVSGYSSALTPNLWARGA